MRWRPTFRSRICRSARSGALAASESALPAAVGDYTDFFASIYHATNAGSEITRNGAQPLTLPNGELRAFLDDGDSVILRGYCEKPGARRIGFGECAGTVLPARR
jgi:hypothetical protein